MHFTVNLVTGSLKSSCMILCNHAHWTLSSSALMTVCITSMVRWSRQGFDCCDESIMRLRAMVQWTGSLTGAVSTGQTALWFLPMRDFVIWIFGVPRNHGLALQNHEFQCNTCQTVLTVEMLMGAPFASQQKRQKARATLISLI